MKTRILTLLLLLSAFVAQAQTIAPKYLTIQGETGRIRGDVITDGMQFFSATGKPVVPSYLQGYSGLIVIGDTAFRWSPTAHALVPILSSGAPVWGTLVGNIANQTDLMARLNAKQNKLLQGTTAQYFRGDLSLGTFSTDVQTITNPLYAPIAHTHNGLAPSGGAAGSVLMKNSGANYDYSWQPFADRYIVSGSVVGAKYKSIYGNYNDGTSILIGSFQDLMDTSETRAVDTLYKQGLDLMYKLAGATYMLPNVFNDSLSWLAQANDFDIVRPDNSVVTDGTVCVGCRVAIKQSLKDRITALENQADQVGVTHQELADSTNNIRLAINTALANYYTKTQSDARFYPLTGNPSKFVTSTNVASFTASDTARWGNGGGVYYMDDPHRLDSSRVTGTTNKIITYYFHDGTTYAAPFIDLTGGGAGTVTGGTITWPGAIFNTPTTGTVSSGTMTFAPTLATQTASTVLAGPVSGTATPSFRQLQLADISAGSLTRGIVYIDQDGKVKAGDSTYYYRPGQYLVVNGTQNSITGYAANNFSTGNNASSGYTAGNDAGTSLLMRVYGSNYTDVRYQNRSVFSSTNGFTFFPYGIGVNVPKYADYRFYSGVTGGGRNGEGRATPMVWFRQSGQVLINGSDSATLTNPNTLLSVNGSARLDTLFANVVVSNAGVTGSGGGGSTYTLPIASGSTLGGIKVGSGLSIAGDGTLSAAAGSSSSTPTDGWALGGNSGTAGANFLGTTDNRSLRFRTNNNEQFVIDSTGYSFAQAGLSVGGLQKAGAFPAKWKSVQTVSDGDFKPLLALMGSEPVGTAGGTDSLGLKGLEYFYFGSNTGGLYGHYNKARGNWLNPTGVKANDILWGEAARGYLSTGNQFSGSAVGMHWIATQDFTTSAWGTEMQLFTTPNGSDYGNRKWTYLRNDGIWEQPALGGTGNSLMGLNAAGKYYRTGIDPATIGTGGSGTILNNNTAGYVMTGTGTAGTLSGTNVLQVASFTNPQSRPANSVTVAASGVSSSGLAAGDNNTFLRFDDADITPTSFATTYNLGQFGANTYAFMGAVGANFGSYGGLQAAGRTGNVATALPFLFNGLHGSAAPTTPAILMRAGKTDGAGGVAVLGNSEIIFAARNWTNSDAFQVLGNGDIKTLGKIIAVLPTYADEAAATTGGLTTGTLYKTSTGEVRIKL